MIIRKYKPSDCRHLAELFYQTVHAVNAKDYTREQLDAWADGCVDLEKWNQSFSEHNTVVAIKNEGIATAICSELEQSVEADKITTHASVTAKSFFEHRGYKVVREQQVPRGGISLTNFIMEK